MLNEKGKRLLESDFRVFLQKKVKLGLFQV